MSFLKMRECPACGSANRVPAKHLADAGRCGSCKASLPPDSEPIDVDREGFDEIVGAARVPILVDFWAAWCGPCRSAAPEVRTLAQEMAGRALVLKVNTEEQPDLARRFRVQSIPNFVVIRNGQTVFQQPGLVPRSQMKVWLETAGAAVAHTSQ
jgi:thioredoxin 2